MDAWFNGIQTGMKTQNVNAWFSGIQTGTISYKCSRKKKSDDMETCFGRKVVIVRKYFFFWQKWKKKLNNIKTNGFKWKDSRNNKCITYFFIFHSWVVLLPFFTFCSLHVSLSHIHWFSHLSIKKLLTYSFTPSPLSNFKRF